MSNPKLSLRLTGATVLRDGEMQARSLVLEQGRISKGPLPEVNLAGYYLLPGIIDLHGDAFERHVAPRPSAPFPLDMALCATDRDAATNGITTAWLAQSWSWEGGHRSPDFAENLLSALDAYRAQCVTDLRVQIRCETHTVDTAERLLETVKKYGIDYVIFNNHIDEALHLSRARPEDIAAWANKSGRTPDQHMAVVRTAWEQTPRVPRFLCTLAERFDELGVTYGSHDDPDGDTRERFSTLGARICEFPTARSPAALAKAINDPVIMGAPNVVRGGSQSGNISASTLIADDLVDALVSDYHYPALARAAFQLVKNGVCTLPKAWHMISRNPADLLGLADRGTLDYGKRADVTIVNARTRNVEGTICGGQVSHLTGEAARRFFATPAAVSLAAE
ncbi:alpha-D-ribose 1-methylphosphonate 5-triphosphate diphosphatase [Shimia abyssi]|uniref:Alpha-D-ribose 1-methylphosphonate 5-triphosphate diphosphatase n=1 Tax=Shimia abyssi TaxID=1662395 RepID=A0A2P8F723_9RHOB|nr:alpha-D-ribose 1-methylphosphonate 5-triphosphate diphosphatase [Shimia abyssi]PSL17517.1 alpha-D-ribose 1-methylphosphonate 5-triphosphate diphosphatase [Shimia abyssi]